MYSLSEHTITIRFNFLLCNEKSANCTILKLRNEKGKVLALSEYAMLVKVVQGNNYSVVCIRSKIQR